MIDNNHLLEKMKETLIGSNLLSCVQKRVLLLLSEGVGAPNIYWGQMKLRVKNGKRGVGIYVPTFKFE